jgi:hypothetical protein
MNPGYVVKLEGRKAPVVDRQLQLYACPDCRSFGPPLRGLVEVDKALVELHKE